jgi:hypothetical protein
MLEAFDAVEQPLSGIEFVDFADRISCDESGEDCPRYL